MKRNLKNELFEAAKIGNTTELSKIAKEIYEIHNQEPVQSLSKQLVEACINGDLKKVKEICKEIDPDYIFTKGDSNTIPLYCAMRKGHLEIVKYLIETFNIKFDSISIGRKDKIINSIISSGNVELLKYILNMKFKKITKPLKSIEWVSGSGHIEMFKFLSEMANNDYSRVDKNSVIGLAIQYNKVDMVKYLLSIGFVITRATYEYIDRAIKWDRLAMCEYLAEIGILNKKAL